MFGWLGPRQKQDAEIAYLKRLTHHLSEKSETYERRCQSYSDRLRILEDQFSTKRRELGEAVVEAEVRSSEARLLSMSPYAGLLPPLE